MSSYLDLGLFLPHHPAHGGVLSLIQGAPKVELGGCTKAKKPLFSGNSSQIFSCDTAFQTLPCPSVAEGWERLGMFCLVSITMSSITVISVYFTIIYYYVVDLKWIGRGEDNERR